MKFILYILAGVFCIPEVLVVDKAISGWWPNLESMAHLLVFAALIFVLAITGTVSTLLVKAAKES